MSSKLEKLVLYEGHGESWENESQYNPANPLVTQINYHVGQFVDSITQTNGSQEYPKQGGIAGKEKVTNLDKGEYITGVCVYTQKEGIWKDMIVAMIFSSSKSPRFGFALTNDYEDTSKFNKISKTLPQGCGLAGFNGKTSTNKSTCICVTGLTLLYKKV